MLSAQMSSREQVQLGRAWDWPFTTAGGWGGSPDAGNEALEVIVGHTPPSHLAGGQKIAHAWKGRRMGWLQWSPGLQTRDGAGSSKNPHKTKN